MPLAGNLMKVLRGERGINGRILKVLFHKRLWCAQIFRTYTTLCNHDAKTLSASPKYAAMERLVFPGNKFSYNMESVPNEVISIVIQLGGKWLEYFVLNAFMNSSSLRLYSSSIFDNNFAWRTGLEKSEESSNQYAPYCEERIYAVCVRTATSIFSISAIISFRSSLSNL